VSELLLGSLLIAKILAEKTPAETFVEEFTTLPIFCAIEDFIQGLKAQEIAKPNVDTWTISQQVTQTLASMNSAPLDHSTAKSVQDIWASLKGLTRYSKITAVELRYTRSIIITSEWKLLSWLQLIICQSYINKSSTGNWLERLVHDIDNYHTSNPKRTNEVIQFVSSNYIPVGELDVASFNFRIPGYRMRLSQERTLTATTNCVKKWLNFPSTPMDNLRFRAIDTILAVVPRSILLMEPMWRLYNSPIAVLMGIRRSRRLTDVEFDKIIAVLRTSLDESGLLDPSSPMRLALDVLSDLNTVWVNTSDPKAVRVPKAAERTPKAAASMSFIPSPPSLGITSEDLTVKSKVFLNYLKMLLPIARDGPTQHLNSGEKLISRVAKRPDHLIPFRECAPTRDKARHTVYSGVTNRISPERFWSILVHRGVFYGAPFALEHGGHFSSLQEWTTYLEEEGSERPKDYFVSMGAYGPSNKHRDIDLIPRYWDLRNTWTTFCEKRFTGYMSLFSFLCSEDEPETVENINTYNPVEWKKKPAGGRLREKQSKEAKRRANLMEGEEVTEKPKFPNIGPLTALLICGDLAMTDFVEKPTVEQMAIIIFRLKKGAFLGLERLGLIQPKAMFQEVLSGFSFLYDYLDANLSDEDKILIHFDVSMLEHALCKYTRLVKPSKLL
jgi:hypothetical protein